MTNVEVLQRCALFKDFTEVGLNIFAEIAVERTIPAGSPLFVENMVGESLFVVVSGTVRITQRVGDGEKELAVLGAPAKVKRQLTAEEIAFFRTSAANYAGYAARYRGEGSP